MKNIKILIKNIFLRNNEIVNKKFSFKAINNKRLELGLSYYLIITEINSGNIVLILKNDNFDFEKQFRLSNANPKAEFQCAFTDFEFKIIICLEE